VGRDAEEVKRDGVCVVRLVGEFRCTIIIVDRFWGGFYGPDNYDALEGGIAQFWKDLDCFVNGDVICTVMNILDRG
jgi:hypothetical protein